MLDFIAYPFGFVLKLLYQLFQNYGVALIFFTILVKLLMLPLSIKQQKSTLQTQRIQPLMTQLQEKYKYDKEKLNAEMAKLYQEHKVNPLSGCLPLLIQFPIIIALYQVIINPLKFMFGLDGTVITELQNYFVESGAIEAAKGYVQPLVVARCITPENVAQINEMFSINLTPMNFNFLGLDLGATATLSVVSFLWLIPILSGLTSWLSSKISTMQQQKMQGGKASEQQQSMQTMMMIMPLFSVMITFSLPAGVGLYWIISNLTQIAQQLFLNKRFMEEKEAEDPIVIEPEKKEYKTPKKKKKGKF